jgi:hypothetical protein
LSRKSKCEWFAVAITLTAGCPATDDASEADAAASGEVGAAADGGVDGHQPDSAQPDGSDPYVLVVPDGGSKLDTDEPQCGASSFAAEQVTVETQVEVPEEITEEVTEEVTEDVTEQITEEVVEQVTVEITEQITEQVTEQVTEEVITEKPASLYIMFDQSQSMAGVTGNGNLWTPAVSAVKSFISDPASAGLGVGIQYFPLSGGSCGTGAGYKVPDVAVAALPGNANAISTSLGKHSPNGLGTPIEGALRGVTQYCLTFQAAHPDQQCVAVLVTDGEPELAFGCNENYDTLAGIAAAAKSKGVITFAVGLKGANFTLLDKIAQSGGAPDCDTTSSRFACDVSGGADKLSDALAKIRQTTVTYEKHTVTRPVTRTVTVPVTRTVTRPVTRTITTPVTHTVTNQVTRTITHIEYRTEVQTTPVPCEWGLPSSTEGAFDRDKLNVRWSVADEKTTLLRVSSKADCRPDAWFYDDALHPTRVIACDQTCEQIKAAEDSSIDLLLGCATIVPG